MEKIDIEKAAEQIGISKSSLYNHVRNKKIEHYKIEGKILFEKDDIDKYIKSKKIKVECK